MAEPTLKIVSDAPTVAGEGQTETGTSRRRLRMILLIAVPVLAAIIGLTFYLATGRYISTDNAYVGAQKVLITPDISGKIVHITVHEGQHVKVGDTLFEIDPEPFRLALEQAQAKLESVRTDFAALKTNLKAYGDLAELAKRNTQLKHNDVERKKTLAAMRTGSQLDVDTAVSNEISAQLQTELAEQRRADSLNQLQGDPELPIEKYPPYMQAQAAVEQAQRDLDHTTLRAPIEGTATQVDNIQLGRFVTAGTPMFAVIDTSAPWVDANPKETDITHLRIGQRVTVEIDSFPDHTFHGAVTSVSPGTGAQFAILPPQNASGNWVKVVQRVPVRIQLDRDPATDGLRAGMSATVDIDTGRHHSLASLLGLSSEASARATP